MRDCKDRSNAVGDLIIAAKKVKDRLNDICQREEDDPLSAFGTAEDQMVLKELEDSLDSVFYYRPDNSKLIKDIQEYIDKCLDDYNK